MEDVSDLLKDIRNPSLTRFIQDAIELCKPQYVHICDGSEQEYQALCDELVRKGTFTPLHPTTRPHSYWCHSAASDVARVEEATFICSKLKDDAGPTNNWKDPQEMKKLLISLFTGCMQGRTLYVIPFSMGPIGSSLSHIGVQITDSPYVVCSMKIMTHMGRDVLKQLGNGFFVPCMHSVGMPLKEGQEDVSWPCNAEQKYIVHFPEEKSIWSYGSGYGGNALLGKKSFALRIASVIAKEKMWLAEHMLILGITNPSGKKKYIAAAFPSQCGKTNLAMIASKMPGWKVECVGDDIAWIKVGRDGKLYAINPEAGFFGVAPGTSLESNPNAMKMIERNTIFTNVALTADKDVWWEGMTKLPPSSLTSWEGKPWNISLGTPAAHPNGRFTVSIRQCPSVDPRWCDPEGVPIDAIIFGGRRSSVVPLVYESLSWAHGVFMGASISSETTAAAAGAVGKLRHDPFAMLPFCGYNMGDYFAHWIQMGKQTDPAKLPKLFYVNWFRKSKSGAWLWPGFRENVRVLKWIFERTDDQDNREITPIGLVPKRNSLDITGLALSQDTMDELLSIDIEEWKQEVKGLREYFSLFANRLPHAINEELNALERRLDHANAHPKSKTG